MRLESWIEQLVEEPFVRLFAGQLLPQEVAMHLVRAMEDGERHATDGLPEIAGRYCITLNPADLHALQTHHPQLTEELTAALKSLIERMDMRLRQTPGIILRADASLPQRSVHITPETYADAREPTRDLDVSCLAQPLAADSAPRQRAYLIVKGLKIFDLDRPVLNIGRALDNDLILEDHRISRRHARLRQRYGRYILQDLGSSGGTTVNGFQVQEIVLRAGDLISFAGVDILYAEEEAAVEPEIARGDTRPFELPGGCP